MKRRIENAEQSPLCGCECVAGRNLSLTAAQTRSSIEALTVCVCVIGVLLHPIATGARGRSTIEGHGTQSLTSALLDLAGTALPLSLRRARIARPALR